LSGHEFFPFLSAKVQNILHREHREQGFFEHVYVVQIVVTTKNCNSSYNFGIEVVAAFCYGTCNGMKCAICIGNKCATLNFTDVLQFVYKKF